jgi:hypothetical protein
MPNFTVECGVDHYRILGPNGEEGERVTWEGIACLKIGEQIYYCEGDPDADEQLVEKVVTSDARGITVELVEVCYDDEEPEDDDDEDEADDDADEEEEESPGPELVETK